MNAQKTVQATIVDLNKPIAHVVGLPPVVVNVATRPSNDYTGGGTANTFKHERYVLLSALPAELQQRIVTALEILKGSM